MIWLNIHTQTWCDVKYDDTMSEWNIAITSQQSKYFFCPDVWNNGHKKNLDCRLLQKIKGIGKAKMTFYLLKVLD